MNEDIRKTKDWLDFRDAVDKIIEQMKCPSREGMIDALTNAGNISPVETITLEFAQGNTTLMSWEMFPDEVLYGKLETYLKGLYIYGTKRFGEEALKEVVR